MNHKYMKFMLINHFRIKYMRDKNHMIIKALIQINN